MVLLSLKILILFDSSLFIGYPNSFAISKAAGLIIPVGLDPAEKPMKYSLVRRLAAISPIIERAELPVQINKTLCCLG